MSEKIYLDYDKVVDAIRAHPNDVRLILNAIDELPEEDAVPVVHCKQCRDWDESWESIHGTKGHYCWRVDMFTESGEYCSKGEPK